MAYTARPHFRDAVPGDESGLTSLEQSANLLALAHIFPPAEYPYPTDEVRGRWQELLRDPAVRVCVSEDDDGLTTLIAFDMTLVRHLAVRPNVWGTDLAKAAMEWSASRAAVQRLWCLESNRRALGFYEYLGWTRTGHRQSAEFPPYPTEIELRLTRK